MSIVCIAFDATEIVGLNHCHKLLVFDLITCSFQSGKTALWYAVEKDHTDVVKELLEFGAFTESQRKVS